MAKKQWLLAVMLSLLGTAAQAEGRTSILMSPYVGYSHLSFEGEVLRNGEDASFDAVFGGASLGLRAPFGLQMEVGRSTAFHIDLLDSDNDFELTQLYALIGWRVEFGDGWQITPAVGRAQWKLANEELELLDASGERVRRLDGYDNFYEVSLAREINEAFSLGIKLRNVNEDWGHARSAAVQASFSF